MERLFLLHQNVSFLPTAPASRASTSKRNNTVVDDEDERNPETEVSWTELRLSIRRKSLSMRGLGFLLGKEEVESGEEAIAIE